MTTTLTVFEHETLRVGKGDPHLSKDQFRALERYYGQGVPYFSLVYDGIRFNQHVGVIQVGNTVIEVLPKADQMTGDANEWRKRLVGMLRAVGGFDIRTTSESDRKIKPDAILELYFEMFLNETAYLVHNGLVKKYRKEDGNSLALRGSLRFSEQIRENLVHRERFFVRHTVYDTNHLLHRILYKTLRLLERINTIPHLYSRIGAMLLDFPEMPDIRVTPATFEKLRFNRKTASYRKAIEIAKMLLLQYHPDLSGGRNHVLALMFDMNKLWEEFIYVSLRKHLSSGETIVIQKHYRYFWKPEPGQRMKMIPDIWLKRESGSIILDTKWKNLSGMKPSPDDLRQMYVYHEYYNAGKVALVYPGAADCATVKGYYLDPLQGRPTTKECSILPLPVGTDIRRWQSDISDTVSAWINQ